MSFELSVYEPFIFDARSVYTCALNSHGGVEAHFTVTTLDSGDGSILNPKFKVKNSIDS